LHAENPNKQIGLNLTNDDIEGSKPTPYTFKSGRGVDPLNPTYKLPQCQDHKIEPPKFLRDTNQIDDIAGTRSRPLFRFNQRGVNKVEDIEGAQVGWRPRHARGHRTRDIMAVQDINETGFKSTRQSDPLNPSHFINGMEIKDDPKSKPRQGPAARDAGKAPTFCLTTQDIEGAQPGWKPKHLNGGIPEEKRRHYRNSNFIGDIQGAQADSKTHGIRTMRMSDPMNPAYMSLDGTPLVDTARFAIPETNHPNMRHNLTNAGQSIVGASRNLSFTQATGSTNAQIAQLQAEITRLENSSNRSSDATATNRMIIQRSNDAVPADTRKMTPSQRRADAELNESIASVRDLS